MSIVLGNIGFLKEKQYDTFLICKIKEDYSFICMQKGNLDPVRKQIVTSLDDTIDHVIFTLISNFIKMKLKSFEFWYSEKKESFLSLQSENGRELHIRGIVQENDAIYQMALERYLESRNSFLEQSSKINNIQFLGFPNSNISSYLSERNNRMSFQFLLHKEHLMPFEEEFITKIINKIFCQNTGLLVLEEHFCFSKNRNVQSQQIYLLKKGSIQVSFDSCFLEIMNTCISEFETTSGKKLYRVLRGGKL